MRKVYTVTSSFLFKLMKHCSQLNNEIDVIKTFEKIAGGNSDILTGENIDSLDQDVNDDSIPDHLIDLKQALEGALDDDDDDDE